MTNSGLVRIIAGMDNTMNTNTNPDLAPTWADMFYEGSTAEEREAGRKIMDEALNGPPVPLVPSDPLTPEELEELRDL